MIAHVRFGPDMRGWGATGLQVEILEVKECLESGSTCSDNVHEVLKTRTDLPTKGQRGSNIHELHIFCLPNLGGIRKNVWDSCRFSIFSCRTAYMNLA